MIISTNKPKQTVIVCKVRHVLGVPYNIVDRQIDLLEYCRFLNQAVTLTQAPNVSLLWHLIKLTIAPVADVLFFHFNVHFWKKKLAEQ